MKYYLLDHLKEIQAVDLENLPSEEYPEALLFLSEAWEHNRRVKFTKLGKVKISTVFLMIDHAPSNRNQPICFETMIFGGKFDLYCVRSQSYQAALSQHDDAVAMVASARTRARMKWYALILLVLSLAYIALNLYFF